MHNSHHMVCDCDWIDHDPCDCAWSAGYRSPTDDYIRSFDPAPILDRIDGMSGEEAAQLLGTNRDAVHRWRNGARMKITSADRCAIALGLHPALLWPEYQPRAVREEAHQ